MAYREKDRLAALENQFEDMVERQDFLLNQVTKLERGKIIMGSLKNILTVLCAALPVFVIGLLFLIPADMWTHPRQWGTGALAALATAVWIVRINYPQEQQ
jgi:hypothetical protein